MKVLLTSKINLNYDLGLNGMLDAANFKSVNPEIYEALPALIEGENHHCVLATGQVEKEVMVVELDDWEMRHNPHNILYERGLQSCGLYELIAWKYS